MGKRLPSGGSFISATVINGSRAVVLATGRDRGELGKSRKKVSKLAFGDFLTWSGYVLGS